MLLRPGVCTQDNSRVGSSRAQGAASLGRACWPCVCAPSVPVAPRQAAQRLTALPVCAPRLFLSFEDMGPAPQLQGHQGTAPRASPSDLLPLQS